MRNTAKPSLILFSSLASGTLFGAGLALSGMIHPEVVLSFLLLHDMGLLLVMGGAAGVVMLAYRVLPVWMKQPLFGRKFGHHPSVLNCRTIAGAAIFGAGWGLCGVCPGPAIAGLGAGNWPLLYTVAGLLLGAWLEGRFLAGQ